MKRSRESLAINEKIGNQQGEAASMGNLGIIINSKDQHVEERRIYTEAVQIWREILIPIEPWFIENGY